MRLFAVFHLNVFFSSVEEELRPEVLRKCYWPLLRLIEQSPLRAGIEAPAATLEVLNDLDRAWIDKLRDLIARGKAELIGSGYAQIIGPLVPAEVNAANLRIGIQRYEALIGVRPRIALVNEQSFSSGLIRHYLDAGFEAIVMEWNNAAREHTDWPKSVRMRPATALDQSGRTIPVLWNDSVAFQKFQRFAHGEAELEDELAFLRSQVHPDSEALCLYGNDVEIFDFRPGRFATETQVEASEWSRIQTLVDAISRDPQFSFALPSEVLAECSRDEVPRRLESSRAPVLVKKQLKYNVTRWAVTGRDDLGINTACWRVYQRLRADASATDDEWRELCYLWSSDFRTHITTQRWAAYRKRLERADHNARKPQRPQTSERAIADDDPRVQRERRRLTIQGAGVNIVVSLRRGMALERMTFVDVCAESLAGTIPHGTLEDIEWSADWYSGNLVFEAPGSHKVTDLEPAQSVEVTEGEGGAILIRGTIPTRLGAIHKTVVLGAPAGTVEIRYQLDWPAVPRGSLRLGFLSLMPNVFDEKTLAFRTHNGGFEPETFPLTNAVVEHGRPVSFLVSASTGLAMTDGILEIGDARKRIRIEVDKTAAALVAMVTHRRIGESFFCQVQLSAMELDDTNVATAADAKPLPVISIRYSGYRVPTESSSHVAS